MPYADVYITNGGYGRSNLAIDHNFRWLLQAYMKGKMRYCTRIGYFNYGINLKTETPIPRQIRNAVFETIRNPLYKQNVEELSGNLNLIIQMNYLKNTLRINSPATKFLK